VEFFIWRWRKAGMEFFWEFAGVFGTAMFCIVVFWVLVFFVCCLLPAPKKPPVAVPEHIFVRLVEAQRRFDAAKDGEIVPVDNDLLPYIKQK
jgi:hypothetical protein